MSNDKNKNKHHWSGWPGAICLHCGSEDPMEIALADNLVDFGPHLGPGVMKWKSEEMRKEYEKYLICSVGYSENCGQCKGASLRRAT